MTAHEPLQKIFMKNLNEVFSDMDLIVNIETWNQISLSVGSQAVGQVRTSIWSQVSPILAILDLRYKYGKQQ